MLRTLILLKRYILLKEQRQWLRDKELDGIMDFYEWAQPMFIFIGLFIFKMICIKTSFSVYKIMACGAFVLLAVVGESHFDRSRNNDAPI